MYVLCVLHLCVINDDDDDDTAVTTFWCNLTRDHYVMTAAARVHSYERTVLQCDVVCSLNGNFVPTYFRSQERKCHRWNFRSLVLSLPGTLAPWNFVFWNFRSLELSLLGLSYPGTFFPLVQILLLNRKAYRHRCLLDCISTSHIVSRDHKTYITVKVCRPTRIMPSPRHTLLRGQMRVGAGISSCMKHSSSRRRLIQESLANPRVSARL